MSLQAIFDGSFPDQEIWVDGPVLPDDGGRWTLGKLAVYFHIEDHILSALFKSNERFRKLLHAVIDHRGYLSHSHKTLNFTKRELRDAKAIVEDECRRKWTIEKLAQKIGYNKNTVGKVLREEESLLKLLKGRRDSRGHTRLPRDLRLTNEDIKTAEAIVGDHIGLRFWSTKYRLRVCKDCDSDEHPHHRGGRCAPCDWKATGVLNPIAGKGLWAPKHGLKRCKGCQCTKRPHSGKGYCARCYQSFKRGRKAFTVDKKTGRRVWTK